MSSNLRSTRDNLHVLEFIDDMSGAYAVADLAICRAGAMTLAELAMTGTAGNPDSLSLCHGRSSNGQRAFLSLTGRPQ